MKKLTTDGYTYKITAEEERIFKKAAKHSLEEEKPKTAKMALHYKDTSNNIHYVESDSNTNKRSIQRT
jgi:hypothetical protein